MMARYRGGKAVPAIHEKPLCLNRMTILHVCDGRRHCIVAAGTRRNETRVGNSSCLRFLFSLFLLVTCN